MNDDLITHVQNTLIKIDQFLSNICRDPIDTYYINNFLKKYDQENYLSQANEELTHDNKLSTFSILKSEEVEKVDSCLEEVHKETKTASKFSYKINCSSHNTNERLSFISVKRENIDKKIIKFIKKKVRFDRKDYSNNTFIQNFIKNKYTTPFDLDGIAFKSVNSSYIHWILSHKEIVIAYNELVDNKFDMMYYNLVGCYKIKLDKDLVSLRKYLRNFILIHS